MSRRAVNKPYSGFTLIEMMLAILLFSIASAPLFGLMIQQAKTFQTHRNNIQVQQELQTVVRILHKDIKAATRTDANHSAIYKPSIMTIYKDCLIYGYPSGKNLQRGIRLKNGRLQISRNSSGCGKGYWESITDSRLYRINSLNFDYDPAFSECSKHPDAQHCDISDPLRPLIRTSIDYQHAVDDRKMQLDRRFVLHDAVLLTSL